MSSSEAKARIETMRGISRSHTQVRTFMKRNGLKYLKEGHIPVQANTIKQIKPILLLVDIRKIGNRNFIKYIFIRSKK